MTQRQLVAHLFLVERRQARAYHTQLYIAALGAGGGEKAINDQLKAWADQ
jgi:hypothetical protein